VSNPYYTRQHEFIPASTARGAEVKFEYNAVEVGFDRVNAEVARIDSAIIGIDPEASGDFYSTLDHKWFLRQTNADDTNYLADTAPKIDPAGSVELPDGFAINFAPATTNVGAATLNLGSSDGTNGAVPIRKKVGDTYVDLDAGDLPNDAVVELVFYYSNPIDPLTGRWVLTTVPSSLPVGSVGWR